MTKDKNCSVVFTGHVDHGKSSVIGRLMYETGTLADGKFNEVKKACENRGKEFEWSFLLDAFQAERDQSVTIDTTRVYLSLKNTNIEIIDAPGHVDFIKNMITGAVNASKAVLIIDASRGIEEQTLRHTFILKLIGIDNICVFINKIDLINYDKRKIVALSSKVFSYLRHVGFGDVKVIAGSAKGGENLFKYNFTSNLAYKKSLVDYMVSSTEHSSVREKFKFIVQDIYKFTQKRIIVGKVISGRAAIGGKVRIHPNERLSTIKSFPDWKNKSKRTINSGESACIEIQDDIFVDRGDLITDQYKPLVSDRFFCNLFSISGQDLKEGQKFNLRYLTKDVAVQIVKIESVLNPIADKLIDGKNIPQNHYAKVQLQSNELLSLDAEKSQNTTKRFVLSDDFRVAALGFFEDDDFRKIEKERTTKSQNITHVFHEISAKEREKKSGHGGGVLWFTGLSASGKSTLGNRVEKILFDKGYNVTLLDGDNLRFGLNNDLGFSEKDRDENIRRAAEVSSLFARRGFLVISTFISPYDKQRANARKIIGKNFHEIYVKASLKNCEKRDPKGLYKKARRGEIQMFSGISAPYEEPGNPELLLNTNRVNIEKCTEKLVGYVKNHFRIIG